MWNLSWLRCQLMITVRWERYPLVDQHPEAHRWLQFLANIGRAANTIDAYGRAVEDHLRFCALAGVEPLTIRADVVAAWIGDMFERANPRSREVAYGKASAQLFASYLAYRRGRFGRLDGALLPSESRRNAGTPLGVSSWSKIVEGISERSGLPQLATHTFRHLRLTDLARAEWTIDQIAQYAGHRDLSTTMRYIHLSGRELAARLHRASASIQQDRERLLAALAVAR
jgi:integrase